MRARLTLIGLIWLASPCAADWTARLDRGLAAVDAGHVDRGIEALRAALESAERALGYEDLDVARLHNVLGLALQRRGRYEEARSLHNRARVLQEQALDPGDPERGDTYRALALAHLGNDQPAKAGKFIRRAFDIYFGPDTRHMHRKLQTHETVAMALVRLREYPGAIAEYHTVLRWLDRVYPAGDPRGASACVRAAEFLSRVGRLDDVVQCLDRSVGTLGHELGHETAVLLPVLLLVASPHEAALASPLVGEASQRLVDAQQRMLAPRYASLDESLDQVDASKVDLEKTPGFTRMLLEMQAEQRRSGHAYDVSEVRAGVALAARDLYGGRMERARAGMEQALQASSTAPTGRRAAPHYHLGNLHLAQGRYADAERHLRAALEALEASTGAGALSVGLPLSSLAVLAVASGDDDAAEMLLEQARKSWAGRTLPVPKLADAAAARAETVLALGDAARAEGLFRVAFGLHAYHRGLDDPRAQSAWDGVARALSARGLVDLARAHERLARKR